MLILFPTTVTSPKIRTSRLFSFINFIGLSLVFVTFTGSNLDGVESLEINIDWTPWERYLNSLGPLTLNGSTENFFYLS